MRNPIYYIEENCVQFEFLPSEVSSIKMDKYSLYQTLNICLLKVFSAEIKGVYDFNVGKNVERLRISIRVEK